MVALASRQFDMARVLLKRVDSGLAVRDAQGATALHMAIRSGHAGIVESLRDCDGVNLNAVNEAGLTAIELAFQNGKPELAFILMKYPGTDRNPVLPWIEREKGMIDFFRQHAPLNDLFLSDAKLLQSELARWADFARSDGTKNLRQKAATNYVLGQLLLRFPPSGLPESSMHGVKRFQLALAQQLFHDDGRFSVDAQSYASALLDSAPDAPAFDLGGYSFTRNEIEDMAAARGFYNLPQSER